MEISEVVEHDPKLFEQKYVHEVYEKIARHFDHTRYKPWPKVKEFLEELPSYSIVLDIGSGNGKYLNLVKDIQMIGIDRCKNLNCIVACKDAEIVQGDILQLPFKQKLFDACICIAVLHHISTTERRLKAIKEIANITKIGGLILLQVWAYEQESMYQEIKDIEANITQNQTHFLNSDIEGDDMQNKDLPTTLSVHKNRTQFKDKNVLVPWNLKIKNETTNHPENNNVYYRFYHVFKQNEINKLLSHVDELSIIYSYYDKGNWAYILKRK